MLRIGGQMTFFSQIFFLNIIYTYSHREIRLKILGLCLSTPPTCGACDKFHVCIQSFPKHVFGHPLNLWYIRKCIFLLRANIPIANMGCSRSKAVDPGLPFCHYNIWYQKWFFLQPRFKPQKTYFQNNNCLAFMLQQQKTYNHWL